jgi:hypothetical protein
MALMLQFPNPSGRKWRKPPIAQTVRQLGAGAAHLIDLEALRMEDPYERADDQVEYVTVERAVRKRVPDYEADVLYRFGWRRVENDQ